MKAFIAIIAMISAVTAQQKIYEHNYVTPNSKNYRSEDGLGNYNFGYDIEDADGGSFRRESGNANGVKQGSYGLRGSDGRVRVVHYIADEHGFRVAMTSNEPGIVASSPADVSINGADVRYSFDTQGASRPQAEQVPSNYQINSEYSNNRIDNKVIAVRQNRRPILQAAASQPLVYKARKPAVRLAASPSRPRVSTVAAPSTYRGSGSSVVFNTPFSNYNY